MTPVKGKPKKGWQAQKHRRFLKKLSSGKPDDPPIHYTPRERSNSRHKTMGGLTCQQMRSARDMRWETT